MNKIELERNPLSNREICYTTFCHSQQQYTVFLKNKERSPWWLSVQESTCQCRRHPDQETPDPWSRKIPHAADQLSSWATTIESVLQSQGTKTTEAHASYSLCLGNKRGHIRGKSEHCNKSRPHSLQLEKSPSKNKNPAQPKINKIFFKSRGQISC